MSYQKYTDVVLDSSTVGDESNRDNPLFTLYPPLEDVDGVCVMSSQVPFSYFVIDLTNNLINVTVTDSGSKIYKLYLIPGNYNSNSFVSMFNSVTTVTYSSSTQDSQFNGGVQVVSGGGAATDLSSSKYYLTCFVYPGTSKITFYLANSTYYGNTFSLDFSNSSTNGLKDILGFRSAVYTSSQAVVYDASDVLIGNTNNIEAPFTVSLTGPATLFLKSQQLSGLVPNGSVRSTNTRDPLFSYMPVNNNYQGILQWTNAAPLPTPLTRCTLSQIDFSWKLSGRDRYDADPNNAGAKPYVQLQGQSFQIVVRFYQASKTTEVMNMDSRGNKVISSISNIEGSKMPNEKVFKKDNVRTDIKRKRF